MIRLTVATLLGCLVLAGLQARAVAQQELEDASQPPSGVADDPLKSTTDQRAQDRDAARRTADSAERESRDPSAQAALGVMLTDSPAGPWINSVYTGGPASQVGLRTGDRIIGINEQLCHTVGDVIDLIREHHLEVMVND